MNRGVRILLIDEDRRVTTQLRRILAGEGHKVELMQEGVQGLARACDQSFDLVFTELKLPGLSGLELIRQLHAAKPHLPIIVLTGHGTAESAIEATKLGAYDYLLKPFEIPQLLELLRKVFRSRHPQGDPPPPGRARLARGSLVGRSAAMQAVYKEIGRVASRLINVLIRGETGTGKELIARAIHDHSDRAKGPFIDINCAAIPETLLESELFGHERGAFTGAEARCIGRFEQASHGTLFLDEIGDMTPGTQVKLMRVLQEKCLQRLGGKETIPVDVRVIAATHRDLEAAIRDKQFREDLYFRLSVVVITLPPLRQRREDISELVLHFLQKYGVELGHPNPSIEPKAMDLLEAQAWPGNVRELENTVRNLLLLAQGFTIDLELVRMALKKPASTTVSGVRSLGDYVDNLLAAASCGELPDAHERLLETAERELFTRAIQRAHGNQAQVARWLGLTRTTVRQKLLRFGLHPHQTRPSRLPAVSAGLSQSRSHPRERPS
jgi:DNA-binding NtrC family response regulator